MRDTPRTDAVQYREILEWVVDADYARKLERELSAMALAKDKALAALKHDVDPRWVCHGDECASRGPAPYDGSPGDDGCDCWVSARRKLIRELEEVES